MKKGKTKSILTRVVSAMLVVAILQTVVFSGMILAGGTVSQLEQSSTQGLKDHVSWCADDIQDEMLTYWGSMGIFEGQFQENYHSFLSENQITSEQFDADPEYQKQFIPEIASELVQLLRQNKVNGVYLILNGNTGLNPPQNGEKIVKQGISIRDMDQDAGYLETEDLLLDRAPASVLNKMNIPLDSNWEAAYTMDESRYCNDYYYPLKAAQENPDADWRDLGYWSQLHQSVSQNNYVISYSIPLRDGDGHIVGVAGIELMESYLRKKMPADMLSASSQGEYILAVTDKEKNDFQIITAEGYNYIRQFKDTTKLSLGRKTRNGCFELETKGRFPKVYAAMGELKLYSSGNIFEGEQWCLLALLDEKELYQTSNEIKRMLFMSMAIALLCAVVGGIILSRALVRPVDALSREIKQINPNQMPTLKRTQILEIDQLASEIEQLRSHVLESDSKLGTILNLSEFPIAAFEVNPVKKTVFFTEQFFDILNYDVKPGEKERLTDYDAFIKKFRSQDRAIIMREENDNRFTANYQFQDEDGKDKWSRIHALKKGEKVLGIVLDVTSENLEKIQLQHERDHDLLTNLYNRGAFHSKMHELFRKPEELGLAAMIMIDLDNLKYVNDSYGHDSGDDYIKAAARGLEQSMDDRMLLARMSGDEFYVFIHHYDDKEKMREKIKKIHEHAKSQSIKTKEKEIFVRMTGGVAWYPENTAAYDELIHYADFAMYQAKRYSKGRFQEFSMDEYERDSYLLRNCGELNTVIEGEQVQYYFQPIVDAKTGEVFAYEALIRPISQIIKGPDELLNLAKSQGRLYQIEMLTWKKALEFFRGNSYAMQSDCKVFINSVSSQILNAKDFKTIEEQNQDLLNRVVLELTEEERLDNEFTEEKRNYLTKWGAQLALDDFGSGYNGENLLLELNPDYVKVDMNIIRNIDKDENRQIVFRNLISYTRDRRIKVIAEGVETVEEFRYVRDGGADLIQGYLTGRPDPELKGLAPEARSLFEE